MHSHPLSQTRAKVLSPLLQIEQQQQTSGYFHTLKGRRAALVVAVGEHEQHGLASADSFQVIAVKEVLLATAVIVLACPNQLCSSKHVWMFLTA